MSNLITDEKKTIWRLDAYDCKEGCNCLKVRFSNKNTWACVRAEIFCDNSPIGLCVLVNSEKENTSYCETDRISGVHNIELRLSHPSDILEAELMDSDVYKDAGYVPTNEKDLCDTDSQSWEAVDMLGRKVASVEDVKGYRPEKKVGIFYWTWREGHSERRPVNVSKLLEKYPAAEYDMFYPQLGVKLCSMAGGGVQKIYMVFLREPSRRDRSGSDLFHLWDRFEIKMNFDRNVSCFIFVNAFMHNDFFD